MEFAEQVILNTGLALKRSQHPLLGTFLIGVASLASPP